jgi:hypothetical protein
VHPHVRAIAYTSSGPACRATSDFGVAVRAVLCDEEYGEEGEGAESHFVAGGCGFGAGRFYIFVWVYFVCIYVCICVEREGKSCGRVLIN